jgi:hypothetical protein
MAELPPPRSTPLTPRAETCPKRAGASRTTPMLPPPRRRRTAPPLKPVNSQQYKSWWWIPQKIYLDGYPGNPHQVSSLDSPVTFWKSYLYDETHCVLAQLAVRIFEAIANSVASERAFSAMNLIHTKLRNRLGAEKANKLIYIYMNSWGERSQVRRS